MHHTETTCVSGSFRIGSSLGDQHQHAHVHGHWHVEAPTRSKGWLSVMKLLFTALIYETCGRCASTSGERGMIVRETEATSSYDLV